MSSSYGADVAIGRQPWSELRYKASHGSHPPTVGRSLSGALERAPPLQWVLRSRRQCLSQERHALFPGGRVPGTVKSSIPQVSSSGIVSTFSRSNRKTSFALVIG